MAIGTLQTHRTKAAALVVAVFVPAVVAGQQPSRPAAGPGRVSVFGAVGANAQVDDESSLGQGLGFSGGATIRLSRRTSVGIELVRLAHERDLTYYVAPSGRLGSPVAVHSTLTGSATYVLGQLTYVFSTSRIQPFVSGSFGVMRYSGTPWGAVFPDSPLSPEARFQTTASAMGVSGGAKIMLGRGAWAGPQAGLLMSGTAESGTKGAIYGGVRAGFDW